MKKLKVAAIQAVSIAANWDDRWRGVDVPRALDLLRQAAARGADVACFPELYPLVGRQELRAEARQLGIYVVAGLADGVRERWFNTSTIISAGGELIGAQAKNYPTATEVDMGVVAGDKFEVFETDIGRFGIVICADFAFFNDGVEASKRQNADIIFNPSLWFALCEAYPHTVIGRHLEYSVPVFGVNLGRPADSGEDSSFAPAGGFTTVCVPPPVTDLDHLWDWFRTKPGGIDSTDGFVFTLGRNEDILLVDVDIDAVRKFPGYFSTRQPERGAEGGVRQ